MSDIGKGIATAGIWIGVAATAFSSEPMIAALGFFFGMFATIFIW